MSKLEKFEWRLTWAGRPDSDMLRACFEHLQVFPLFRDSKARLVDFGEYQKLITDGLLEPALSYWQIKEGEVGLITQAYYEGYTNTWEKVNTAKGDFEEGWIACERRDKFLADWDEAIAMEKARKERLKTKVRRTTIQIKSSLQVDPDLRKLEKQYKLIDCHWKETRYGRPIDKYGNYTLIIRVKCTESELEELANKIYYDLTY